MKTFLIIGGVLAVLFLLNAGCAAVRGGYASAPYKVVRADGKFEVREYPELVLVETPMHGANNGFMRLFHYIDGQNAAHQKLAMTTPVFMARGASNGTMAFVLPPGVSSASAPSPAGTDVRVREQAGGRFAVLRFTGGISPAHEAKALARLQSWLGQAKLTAVGDPIYGYFDPPWTPPCFRRNEVMLRLVAVP